MPVVYELSIEKLVQGGEGLARLPDGRVCFVRGGLPGERCRVELTVGKKDFARGRVLEVLEGSVDRVQPRCPLYGKCGGCSLQHLESAKQVPYLERVERENFRRMCREELPEDFVIYQGEPWGYRNRARVVYLGERDGRCRFGFREQESNGVVAVENCPVLTPALNDFLKNTTAAELFGDAAFKGAAAGSKRVPRDLEISLFDNGAGKVSFFYKGMPPKLRDSRCPAQVEIQGRHIQSDASVFFQSNLSLLPRLVQSVQQAVDEGIASGAATDEWLIDLFSGVGFFACILQDRFKHITTVERDPLCLKYAEVNLSEVRKEMPGRAGHDMSLVENVAAPAEEWLAKNVVDVPATLIVDPPRTGLPPEALTAIVKSSVQRLIYVSCDPVTLFRDFAKFRAAGFELKKAEGFAFYPQTPHLEMMFVLSR